VVQNAARTYLEWDSKRCLSMPELRLEKARSLWAPCLPVALGFGCMWRQTLRCVTDGIHGTRRVCTVQCVTAWAVISLVPTDFVPVCPGFPGVQRPTLLNIRKP